MRRISTRVEILTRRGLRIVEIALDDEAKANLQVSVDAVKELLEACKGIDGSLA